MTVPAPSRSGSHEFLAECAEQWAAEGAIALQKIAALVFEGHIILVIAHPDLQVASMIEMLRSGPWPGIVIIDDSLGRGPGLWPFASDAAVTFGGLVIIPPRVSDAEIAQLRRFLSGTHALCVVVTPPEASTAWSSLPFGALVFDGTNHRWQWVAAS